LYSDVDDMLVWEVLTADLPVLQEDVERLLGQSES
jgi:uncharacterized protein with HEPN domain